MKITINGKIKEYKEGITGKEIIEQENIKNILAMKVNNELKDLSSKIKKDSEIKFLRFEDREGKEIFWHSSAHVLAEAIEKLFPNAKKTIGPTIELGFYYDFDDLKLTEEDFSKIETEIKKIVEKNEQFERQEWTIKDVKKIFKNNKW